MEHLDTLLEADKDASDTFKNGFNGRDIALDTIKHFLRFQLFLQNKQ
jgi:hypothetical protein